MEGEERICWRDVERRGSRQGKTSHGGVRTEEGIYEGGISMGKQITNNKGDFK